jgi:hypothetical protein
MVAAVAQVNRLVKMARQVVAVHHRNWAAQRLAAKVTQAEIVQQLQTVAAVAVRQQLVITGLALQAAQAAQVRQMRTTAFLQRMQAVAVAQVQ